MVVTINRGDFIHIAGRGRDHAGVILVPSVPAQRLRPLFEAVLLAGEPLLTARPNIFVEIDAAGAITSFTLP